MSSYEELARRNQALAEQQHARSIRQRLRSVMLSAIARLPVPQTPSDGSTILLIRPDHLGDVLLTSPAVKALASAQPEARLVALVGPWSAGIISAYPEIDLTLTLPFPGFSRNPARIPSRSFLMATKWARQLRQIKADSAIIFRPDHWWGAMLAHMAGIPNRIGFDVPDVAPFLTQKQPLVVGHAVEHNMALVSTWADMPIDSVNVNFPVDESDRHYVSQKLTDRGLPEGTPRVIIHPGTGTLIKQWAPVHWARVADHLSTTWGVPIIFTGSDHEIQLVHSITDMMVCPTIAFAGETNVYQLAALYKDAHVVLGPDSGPLHLAAAVGTPTVHLFGPADPVEFGPWGCPSRHAALTTNIACRPCRIIDWPGAGPAEHPCVRDISVDDVIAAALSVVANRQN